MLGEGGRGEVEGIDRQDAFQLLFRSYSAHSLISRTPVLKQPFPFLKLKKSFCNIAEEIHTSLESRQGFILVARFHETYMYFCLPLPYRSHPSYSLILPISMHHSIQGKRYSRTLPTPLLLNKFPRIPNLHTPIPRPTINRHRFLAPQLSPLPFRP